MEEYERSNMTKEDIINSLIPVFQGRGIRRAVLFGSYGKGTQTDNSDIDILVDSGLHGLRFFGLLEDVCTSVDGSVDLIDVYQLKQGSSVAKDIEENGVVIYEQT